MPNEQITKAYFDEAFKGVNGRFDGLQATMTKNTQDIIQHFIRSQGYQNERMDKMDERFDRVDVKLNAIIEMLTMKQEMRNLIRELSNKGIALDEGKIFVG